MSSEITMKCPDCGAIVTGKISFWTRKFTCQNCSRVIDPQKDCMETMNCPSCQNTIMYDTRIGRKQNCPVCGEALDDHAVQETEVTCPSCHMKMLVKANESKHICPVCGTEFDVAKQKAINDVIDHGTPTLITVPADNRNLIYRHPVTSFPYASQVVVPEGYTALILRDGVCLAASDPGKYVLSDSLLKLQGQLVDALRNPNTQISVEIYFVRKRINTKIDWWGPNGGMTVLDETGKIAGKLYSGGYIKLLITDAKKFAEFVRYESCTEGDLIPAGPGRTTGMKETVSKKCFDTVFLLLMDKVRSQGISYNALDTMKIELTGLAKGNIDAALEELGLKNSDFSIDYISFAEDPNVIQQREKEEQELKAKEEEERKKAENEAEIRRFTETAFEWEAPECQIHAKDNLSLSATVSYSGSIRLCIADADRFFASSTVDHWKKNGTTQGAVTDYFARLVSDNSANVIRDILQSMINQTGADIRDLSTYYERVRGYIQQGLSDYFRGYGLAVDLFSYAEKKRTNSYALELDSQLNEHKTVQETEKERYAVDSQWEIDRKWMDARTAVELDNADVQKETALTRNQEKKAENTISQMKTQASITDAREDLDRAHEQKLQSWDRQDAESQAAWNQKMTMTGYQYQSEIDRQKHMDRMQGISDSAQEKASLHYLNQQEIENRAMELHAQWEAERRMQTERAQQNIDMDRMSWNAQKDRTRESAALQHEVEQSAANNDYMINSILRKIAESDLDLQEKKDTYARLLRNQDADDRLRHSVDSANADVSMNYQKAHLKNLLTQEENDYVQKLLDQNTAREETVKNADFLRSMEAKEKDTAHQMEILKLQHEWDAKQAEMAHELELKNIENERLQKMLDYYVQLGKQDVEKTGINAAATAAATAVEKEMQQQQWNYYEHLSEHDVKKTAINAFADRDIKTAEARYAAEKEEAIKAAEEKKNQDTLNREDAYMKRADDLLSQILSIQTSMAKFSKINENSAIQSSANVKMVQAMAEAEVKEKDDGTRKLIREMEDLVDEMQHLSRNIRENQNRDREDRFNYRSRYDFRY